MRKGFIFFLVIIFLLSLEANAKSEFYPALNIYSEINDYEYYRINSYFFQTAYLFNKMYGLETPEYKLEVVIDDKASSNIIKNGKTPETITVITNQKLLFADLRNIERALIKACLLAELSITIEKCESSDIEWIITGTLRKLNQEKDPSFVYPDFPIVNRIIQNRGNLDYQKIITFEFTVKDGIFYDCFLEESQILLNAVLKKKNGREFIFEYIKNICFENKNDKSVFFTRLIEKYHTDFDLSGEKVSNSFNKYLNKTALELAINPRIPLSANKTVDEFAKIINFKDPVSDKKMHINTLAGYLKDRKERDFIIQEEKDRIQRFAGSINILLAEPVRNMIALLDKLKNDKNFSEEDYTDAINEQIKSFYGKVASLKLIEKYLLETEKKKNNIGQKYNLYLQELEKQNDPVTKAWPELKKFMNENYTVGIN